MPLLFRQLLHLGNCIIGSWTVDILLCIFTVIEKHLVHFFNFLFMSRLDRLRREDEGKNRASKKAQDVEQSLLSRVGFISLKLIATCWFLDISCVTNGLSRFHLWQQMPVCFERQNRFCSLYIHQRIRRYVCSAQAALT